MNGPQHLREAEHALVAAKRFIALNPDQRQVAQFERYMRLSEQHARLAQLALDAAVAANTGSLSSAMEVHSDVTQARTDALHANHVAWVEAITGGGTS